MRHEDAQPEHHEVLGAIAEASPNLPPVTAGRKPARIGATSYYPRVSGIDVFEFTFSPVGKEQRNIHLAVLGPVINVIQPVDSRPEDSNNLALLGLLVEVRNIVAHPYNGPA